MMIFVNWSDALSAGTEARDNAMEALQAAEDFFTANRSNVSIFDTAIGRQITIEELRARAAAERGDSISREP
jgi:hypothetical protein